MTDELKVLSDYSITDEEFLARYPHRITDEYILIFLEDIYAEKDGVLMEYMFRITFRISNNYKLVPIFRKLIKETWHRQHENLAGFFQFSVRDPNCVDDIVDAMHIKCDYWYDEGDAFIRKCAYVLGDLQTDYSLRKLQELTMDDSEIIRKYALHQLRRNGGVHKT